MFLPAFVGKKKVTRPQSRQRRLLSYGVSYEGECTKRVKMLNPLIFPTLGAESWSGTGP